MSTPAARRRTLLPAALLALAALPTPSGAAPPREGPAPPVPPAAVGLSAERLARIDRYLEAEVAAKRKAGAVVLIARLGRIAHLKAYGSADLARRRPMRTDDLFRVFSLTKPVTSVALLTLYEQGKFQLSDPLEKYLPAFRNVRLLKGTGANGELVFEDAKRPITIEDVFRNTAGFAHGHVGDAPAERSFREAGIDYTKLDSLRELTEKLGTMPLLHQPATRWEDSLAHDVQAYLVEYFSGMRFDEYCQKTIFGPLGMKDTFFGVPPERAARFATIYHPGPDGQVVAGDGTAGGDGYQHFTRHPFGGVGLSSTARDYLRFAQMLLNSGRLDGARILGRKTVELMTTDHLAPGILPVSPGQGYGLGIGVVTDPAAYGNLASPGEFRWSGFATTAVLIDPKEQLVALLLTQYLPEDANLVHAWTTLVYQAIVD